MLVSELIKQIPSSTFESVKRAKKRYDRLIRDSIRSETRLKLSPSVEGPLKERGKGSAPVHVDEIGYPEVIAARRISPDDMLAAILSLWRPTLVKLRDSSGQIDHLFGNSSGNEFDIPLTKLRESIPNLDKLIPSVQDTFELSEILLNQTTEFDLIKYILSINEDILGVYQYRIPRGLRSSGHIDEEVTFNHRSNIVLYWGVIGLFAKLLEVRVDALTAVVLAHELAHAYTHLGYDIDNYRWGSLNFYESEHEIKEGLAQYYTSRVVINLHERIPGIEDAYRKLLEKQPLAYKTHVPWVKNSTPEAVRNTMILLRKYNPLNFGEFSEQLYTITDDYKPRY